MQRQKIRFRSPPPREIFLRAVTFQKELIFSDSNKEGIGPNGANLVLYFEKDSKVKVVGYGYDIAEARGSYLLTEDGNIQLDMKLNNTKWPSMVLRRSGSELLLYRSDGNNSFHAEWTIYSWNMDGVFPLRSPITHPDEQIGESNSAALRASP